MERQAVTSSSIRSIGHDPETGLLEVEFTSGAVYHHYDVPGEAHEQLMGAESVGSHYNKFIRGIFTHVRKDA